MSFWMRGSDPAQKPLKSSIPVFTVSTGREVEDIFKHFGEADFLGNYYWKGFNADPNDYEQMYDITDRIADFYEGGVGATPHTGSGNLTGILDKEGVTMPKEPAVLGDTENASDHYEFVEKTLYKVEQSLPPAERSEFRAYVRNWWMEPIVPDSHTTKSEDFWEGNEDERIHLMDILGEDLLLQGGWGVGIIDQGVHKDYV